MLRVNHRKSKKQPRKREEWGGVVYENDPHRGKLEANGVLAGFTRRKWQRIQQRPERSNPKDQQETLGRTIRTTRAKDYTKKAHTVALWPPTVQKEQKTRCSEKGNSLIYRTRRSSGVFDRPKSSNPRAKKRGTKPTKFGSTQ